MVTDTAYGSDIKGNMCERYTCRVCGQKATACSYIGRKLVQVYAAPRPGLRDLQRR